MRATTLASQELPVEHRAITSVSKATAGRGDHRGESLACAEKRPAAREGSAHAWEIKLQPSQTRTPQDSAAAVGAVYTHLVDPEVSIGVKVVIFGRHVLSVGLLAAFCLATGDLGGSGWEHGSNLGAPQGLLSLQVPTSPWSNPPKSYHGNLTAPTCHLASPRAPKPKIPFSFYRTPPEHHPGEYPDTSATPTISPVSLPPSLAQPTAGEGRGRQNWGRHKEGQRGAGNGVKEAAIILGEARWGPQTWREFVLSVSGARSKLV